MIGIPGYDLPATPTTKIQKDAGQAVVISGKNGDELALIAGFAAKSEMGFAVAGRGDINNDGFLMSLLARRMYSKILAVSLCYMVPMVERHSVFWPAGKSVNGFCSGADRWNNDMIIVVGFKANESLNWIFCRLCCHFFRQWYCSIVGCRFLW